MRPSEAELVDVLATESAWLHALARRLARDLERAADAAQRTLLGAIERRPEQRASLRAWLATVLRRALREERRVEREAFVRAERTAPTPEETLARLDAQQRIVAAIRALDEPYRSALVQRFLDKRSVREIARLSALPPKTVHTRIERGLAKLRARLDREHGGDRSAWLGALVALRLDSIGPFAKGLGAMQAGTKALAATAAAVAVAVIGTAAWVIVGEPHASEGVEPRALAAAPTEERTSEREHPESSRSDLERSSVGHESAPPATAPLAPDVATLLLGRVEHLDGRPLQGALVRYVDRDGGCDVSALKASARSRCRTTS